MIDTARRTGSPTPHLALPAAAATTVAVALLLHGGRERSDEPVHPWQSAVLRMRPFAAAIRGEAPDVAVARLRYRVRGWNGDGTAPLEDVAWALDALRASIGTVPVVLVGHSLGGRAAVGAAADRSVTGVVALAPWLPRDEPVDPVVGRALVLLHGARDHTTDPARTAAYAARAVASTRGLASLRIEGTGHAMVSRAALWHRLTARFVAAIAHDDPVERVALGADGVTSTLDGVA